MSTAAPTQVGARQPAATAALHLCAVFALAVGLATPPRAALAFFAVAQTLALAGLAVRALRSGAGWRGTEFVVCCAWAALFLAPAWIYTFDSSLLLVGRIDGLKVKYSLLHKM